MCMLLDIQITSFMNDREFINSRDKYIMIIIFYVGKSIKSISLWDLYSWNEPQRETYILNI